MRTIFGFGTTLIWIVLGLFIWFSLDTQGIKINELGDFVAGWVAPLAFLWFILAYYQQKDELKLNTEAIKAQKVELEKQVEALNQQGDALTKSATALQEYSRPYISVSFVIENRDVFIQILNSGIRTAYLPVINFSEPLADVAENNIDHESFLKVKSLAPNQRIVHYLSNMPFIISKKGNKNVLFETVASIRYKDGNGNEFEDEATLNLNIIKNNVILPKSTERSLQEIQKDLTGINRSIQNLRKK